MEAVYHRYEYKCALKVWLAIWGTLVMAGTYIALFYFI